VRPYDHLERLGGDEVEGIDIGTVHVYPKLDGANGRVGMLGGDIRCGSRTRVLGQAGELQGFYDHVQGQKDRFEAYINRLSELLQKERDRFTLYGEWLVPHTLKAYREDAWKRFWIFDVHDGEKYLHQELWEPYTGAYNLDVIPLLRTYIDPSEDQMRGCIHSNTFLITDGGGLGEGVVFKNYGWRNKFGRQQWAKVVRNEFKESNLRVFGTPTIPGEQQVERDIARTGITQALVAKERAKIEQETTERKVLIPRLLETVYHALVTEELWTPLKKANFPSVNFKKLRAFSNALVKEFACDLF
jgi:hypothetical protein